MSRPFPPRSGYSSTPAVRINGKIRAREVRTIGPDGAQLGVLPLHEAISIARAQGMDLVEVAATASPPVCRVVDFGKFKYEQAKKEKESKKHQQAGRVKEVQLSASIDAHDFQTKLEHAVDFLCEDMKVKLSLRFRGREMAHREFGVQVMERFIKELAPYGYSADPPRLVGRGLNGIVNPLPRAKRAKNPRVPGQPAPNSEPERPVSQAGSTPEEPAPMLATEPEPPSAGLDGVPFTPPDQRTG
ncbi:MAG: translation initiation factor IF-3 [Limisphaerales bacterium]